MPMPEEARCMASDERGDYLGVLIIASVASFWSVAGQVTQERTLLLGGAGQC